MKNIFCVLFFTSSLCFGAEVKFPVSTIPDSLKKDVNAVVRESKIVYKITSRSSATLYSYQAITILNNNGKSYAREVVGYSSLSKITSFKASVYDNAGDLIKKLKSSEIEDRSAYDGFSLFSDYRYKSADLTQGSYPYTVEFEYEIDYKYLYSIESPVLIPGEKVSVESTSYELIYPIEFTPRYKALNIKAEPEKSKNEKGIETLRWALKNLMPIKYEPHGPRFIEFLPRIMAAPGLFEYEGYAGDMSTWESFGKWEAEVIKGRDKLPETAKQKVKELTKDLKTTEEKAKVLYEYLQSKTRYVSVQLGIGGLQPFESSLVDQVGYGDCKALSNYMVAMLREAGVKGYYTTIKAGDFRDDLIMDFPSHQGNHVVVAVPNGADTLWLECTSQTNPFGYAGLFTGDRKAFMLNEEGGVWVNTPRYTESKNVQSRYAEVKVQVTGDAIAKIKTTYSGLQYENGNLNFVLTNQYDRQMEWVMENTEIPSFDITSFKFENRKAKIPSAVVSLDLNLKRLATVTGKRLMLTPNLMNKNTFIPEKIENRKTDIIRPIGFVDVDTIKYQIPEEIYPEFLPQPVKITTRFGEFEVSYLVDQGSVLYIRKLKILKGRFPANSYNEMIEFYKGISKADNQKLVFLNKT